MNRRSFLKSIGKVIGGLAVVPSVVKGDGFKKVKHLGDIKAKGMSRKEFEALGLPKMKPLNPEKFNGFQIYNEGVQWGPIIDLQQQKSNLIDSIPECTCPAPYMAFVSGKSVEHFLYCEVQGYAQ